MRFRKFPDQITKNYNRGYTLIELLVVIALLGVLAAVAIPNILGLMNRGGEESRLAEKHNVQLVVQLMLTEADADELDDAYDEVQTLAQIQQVTAGDGAYTLDSYLHLLNSEGGFLQAYDITSDGVVTVD